MTMAERATEAEAETTERVDKIEELPQQGRQNPVHSNAKMLRFLIIVFVSTLVIVANTRVLTETMQPKVAVATKVTRRGDNSSTTDKSERNGFFVLGMHRSGTSMLTGMLHMAAGYTYGWEILTNPENPKGFFERKDATGQNRAWFKKQNITWQEDVLNFNWEEALKDMESGAVLSEEGESFFRFINNETNSPWLQKDPRNCITLKAWLNARKMDKEPAIVFTYRHPLEVAMSLVTRDKLRYNSFKRRVEKPLTLAWCLKLWIAYNMRAIQNSKGLCIVRTSKNAFLGNPFKELERMSNELTNKCGLPAPPQKISQEEIDKFVDPNLINHGNNATKKDRTVLQSFNGGSCVAYAFESETQNGTLKYNEEEREAYLNAMRIYCDLESGKAYEDDYVWPDLRFHIPYEY